MFQRMRTILTVCAVLLAAGAAADEAGVMPLWVPNDAWAFELDLGGFIIQLQDISPDLKGRALQAADSAGRMLLTVFLDPLPTRSTAVQCRDEFLEKIRGQQISLENVTTHDTGNIAIVRYDVVKFKDKSGFRQHNAYAYMVKDTKQITVHISCMDFEPADEEAVARLLGSLRIDEAYRPTVYDYFIFGSWCYRQKDYKRATGFLEQALTLDKQNSALPRTYWLVVVDNLGMAYGISGDRENARRIFEYGLSLEPEYPMFHYNLACYYAESKKLDSALASLGNAYKFEANMLRGEKFPDPFEDSSFKRYWKDKTFKEFMSRVKK